MRWPRLLDTLRTLAGRGPVQRDLDAEVKACFDMLVDEKVGAGMDEGEARRQVRLELDEARDSMPDAWIVRVAARTFGAFGAIALMMATVGLYGVKAYLVARRTREIGIRMALGAGAGDVIRMVLREGAVLLAASIAVGFLLAVGAGQVVSGLLFGVRPFDPLVLCMATFVLAAAVLAACYLPARRATRVSPTSALRAE